MKTNTSFIVARKDRNQVVFFSDDGKELFAIPSSQDDDLAYGFYNFRNDSELIVVRSLSKGVVDVFNKNGVSLLEAPTAASADIGIIYHQSRAEYELFVNFANQMAVYRVRK